MMTLITLSITFSLNPWLLNQLKLLGSSSINMGISSFAANKIATAFLFICFFYLMQNTVHAENKAVPTANLNLPPFLAWRNAMYCLRNYKYPNNPCPWKYRLGLSGSLNVTNSDGESFCKNGCADHTRDVLNCIHYVKSDFWFANKATIKDLSNTVDLLCSTQPGSNGTV